MTLSRRHVDLVNDQTVGGTKTFTGSLGLGTTSNLDKYKLNAIGSGRFTLGVNHGSEALPTYKFNIDFGSDVANTWRRIVVASLAGSPTTYSTVGFRIRVTDSLGNHATPASVNNIREEIYYVACVRTEATVIDTPDSCYVSGPYNRIRAVKTSTGNYEIQIQNESQYKEYLVEIDCYAENAISSHTITYEPGTTLGSTGTAQYDAGITNAQLKIQNLNITGNVFSSVRPLTSLTYDLGSTTNLWGVAYVDKVSTNNTSSRDKLRVWNNSTYTIGMQNSITFGSINNNYAMTFQMSNTAARGWWWGDDAHTTAQGAMALSTDGNLYVASKIRLGYGEADTTVPASWNGTLDVSGNTKITGQLLNAGTSSWIEAKSGPMYPSYVQEMSVSAYETEPRDLYLSSDGTKLFVAGNIGNDITQWTLSTAWDLSTATYNGQFSVATQDTTPTGLTFSPDGTKMFICGTTSGVVSKYDLSTAWTVTTGATFAQTLSISAQDASPQALAFSTDGTKLFVLGDTNNRLYQYTLSSAWDLTSPTYDGFLALTRTSGPFGLAFSSDGTKFWVPDNVYHNMIEYTLSTPWVITSGVTVSNDITMAAFGNNIANKNNYNWLFGGIYVNESAGYMYHTDYNRDIVAQFNISNTGTLAGNTWHADGDFHVKRNLNVSQMAVFGAQVYGLSSYWNGTVQTSTINALGTGLSLSIHDTQAAGTVTVGGTSATGTITIGRSTAAQTIAIGSGVTAAATTKTINIANVASNATSTTNINIGTSSLGTVNINLGSSTGGISVLSTTASTSTTTGALTVAGGVGSGGDIHGVGFIAHPSAAEDAILAFDYSTWGANSYHEIVGWDFASNVKDALILKVPGNSVGAHGTMYLGDEHVYFGVSANSNGVIDVNSATAPFSTETWGYLGKTGMAVNATTASTNTTTGALIVAGGVGVAGTLSAYQVNAQTGSLGTTISSTLVGGAFSVTTGNVSYLNILTVRTSAGSDWTTAGTRLQAKTDATWQGYIQFNGTNNNYGISFGTGSSTVSPDAVTERMKIEQGGAVTILSSLTSPIYKENIATSSGTSKTFDLSLNSVFWHSMTGSGTFSFSNTPASNTVQTITIVTEQSTANSIITWPAAVLWPGNVQPPQSTVAGDIDFWSITVINKGGTLYYIGNLVAKDAS